MAQSEVFLSSRQVRERYSNVSYLWLWRRENEEGSTFPKAVRIRGRRFWKLGDLETWERSLSNTRQEDFHAIAS
jgi:hypothetical protein